MCPQGSMPNLCGKRLQVSKGTDVNPLEPHSHWSLALQVGESSLEIWVKPCRRDQTSGRRVTDDPRLSTSVPSIKDCRKIARLSLERQSTRLGLKPTSAKVIVGLGR